LLTQGTIALIKTRIALGKASVTHEPILHQLLVCLGGSSPPQG